MAYIIGITGSIATGKTTVSKYVKKLGYLLIDSDQLAHDVLEQNQECINKVKKHFPKAFSHNQVDRKILGNIIFNDKEKKEVLNQIIHPYVIVALKKTKEAYQNKNHIIFFDIPLLFEVQLEYLCNEIWVVYTSEDMQLQRLTKRNNYTKEEALLRIHNQISIEKKKTLADKVLDNQKDHQYLYQQIDQYLKEVNNGINGK